jgi:hypothetical protein
MQTTLGVGEGEPLAGEDAYPEAEEFQQPEPAEPEPAEDDEEQELPAPPPAPGQPQPQPAASRPGRRERQAADLRRLREENERLRRDFDAFRQVQQRPAGPDPGEVARREAQEREYVATLMPEQATQYWREKDRTYFQQQLQANRAETLAAIDQTTWQAACRVSPERARMSAEVERLWQDEARQGRPTQREIIFTYLYGQAALQALAQRAAKPPPRQTGPRSAVRTGLRSDGAQPARRPEGDSYEASLERIRGQPLW